MPAWEGGIRPRWTAGKKQQRERKHQYTSDTSNMKLAKLCRKLFGKWSDIYVIFIKIYIWFADLLSSFQPGCTSSDGSTDTGYGGADQSDTLCLTWEDSLHEII